MRKKSQPNEINDKDQSESPKKSRIKGGFLGISKEELEDTARLWEGRPLEFGRDMPQRRAVPSEHKGWQDYLNRLEQ